MRETFDGTYAPGENGPMAVIYKAVLKEGRTFLSDSDDTAVQQDMLISCSDAFSFLKLSERLRPAQAWT